MASPFTKVIPPATWTDFAGADVSNFTMQPDDDVLVKGVAGSTAPTDAAGALTFYKGVIARNEAMADLFLGISATRVFIYSERGCTVAGWYA